MSYSVERCISPWSVSLPPQRSVSLPPPRSVVLLPPRSVSLPPQMPALSSSLFVTKGRRAFEAEGRTSLLELLRTTLLTEGSKHEVLAQFSDNWSKTAPRRFTVGSTDGWNNNKGEVEQLVSVLFNAISVLSRIEGCHTTDVLEKIKNDLGVWGKQTFEKAFGC